MRLIIRTCKFHLGRRAARDVNTGTRGLAVLIGRINFSDCLNDLYNYVGWLLKYTSPSFLSPFSLFLLLVSHYAVMFILARPLVSCSYSCLSVKVASFVLNIKGNFFPLFCSVHLRPKRFFELTSCRTETLKEHLGVCSKKTQPLHLSCPRRR